MSTPFPRASVPKSTFSELPLGKYDLNIEDASLDYDKQMRKQIRLQTRVTSKDGEGMVHFENFRIGTDTDLEADDPQTLTNPDNIGAKMFNQLLDALEFADQDIASLEEFLPTLINLSFTGRINKRPGKGEYADRTFTNINRFYKLGSVPTGFDAGAAPARAATPVRPAAPTRPTNGAAGKPTAAPQRMVPKPQPARTALPAGFSVEEE